MHRLRIDPKNPDRLWTQAHVGVFRSDDGGRSFVDVTEGLPSFHGFPIAITRREPDAVYVGTSNGQVYASIDGGDHWDRLARHAPARTLRYLRRLLRHKKEFAWPE